MRELRAEEIWARACIEAALGDVDVRQHDDGSSDGMYDLDVVIRDSVVAAVEVTSVLDSPTAVLWNLLNSDGRWIEEDLVGGWGLALRSDASARRIKAELPAFLKMLEQTGVHHVLVESPQPGSIERVAARLGIKHMIQGPTDFPGSIYPMPEQSHEKTAGYVADTGDALAEWFGEWARDPVRRDNLEKLGRAEADERHLFVVFPGFADAPFDVADLLMRREAPLPTIPPDLPVEITHVWAASSWDSGDGMRWSPGGGWQRFAKHVQAQQA